MHLWYINLGRIKMKNLKIKYILLPVFSLCFMFVNALRLDYSSILGLSGVSYTGPAAIYGNTYLDVSNSASSLDVVQYQVPFKLKTGDVESGICTGTLVEWNKKIGLLTAAHCIFPLQEINRQMTESGWATGVDLTDYFKIQVLTSSRKDLDGQFFL